MAHDYSTAVIIVKIKCKNPQYRKVRKRLPWCELINPYIFFIVNVFHHTCTSRKTSRRDVIKAPETLESLGSFKVSEAATSHLGLGQNFERLGLGDISFGSRLGLGSEGLVHIPADVCTK